MTAYSDFTSRQAYPATSRSWGAFQTYNGSLNPPVNLRHCIATLDTGGNLQGTYTSVNPTSSTPGTVYAMDTTWGMQGPQLVIGGDFTGAGGKFHQNLARLNPDGTVDDSFPSLVEGPVNAINTLDGGQVLVAGNFGQAAGFGCTSLARLNWDGSFDTSFQPIVTKQDGTVAGLRMVEREDSGNIDIAGNFANIADSSHLMQSRNAFARLNSNGTLDPSFNAQINSTNIPNGSKFKVNAGGNIGGNYGMAGYVKYMGTNDYGFACVLGPDGSWLGSYLLFDGEVNCGTGLADGRILLGGNFTQVNPQTSGPSRGHIVALTSGFTLDGSFAGAGANGPIIDMRTQGDHDNGKPLIVGGFTTYNGVARSGVARLNLDGSLDTSFNPGSGANGPVSAVTWFNNRAAFGGAFSTYNGTPRAGVAQVFASLGANPAPVNLLLLMQ